MTGRISRGGSRACADEPFRTGADDRFHNSGWGRPPEQYRTPRVGGFFRLNYMHLLRAWPNAAAGDARALKKVMARDGRIPAEVVASYAARLAGTIGAPLPRTRVSDPHAALTLLCQAVEARGLTRGVVLMAHTGELYKHDRETRREVPLTDEMVALAVATVVSSSPPLVLWGREPSFAMLRPDLVLQLTWIRRHEASPEAAKAWGQLRSLHIGGMA